MTTSHKFYDLILIPTHKNAAKKDLKIKNYLCEFYRHPRGPQDRKAAFVGFKGDFYEKFNTFSANIFPHQKKDILWCLQIKDFLGMSHTHEWVYEIHSFDGSKISLLSSSEV